MRPKTVLATIALAGLLLTAGCTTSLTPGNAAAVPSNGVAADGASGNTVQVAATGEVQATPDRAVVRVAATARADDVETVRQRLAENATQLRKALADAGVDASQIQTVRYDIGQNYRHEKQASAPEYEGQHVFRITLDDPDQAGPIVVAAVENGASSVEDVRFTLSTEKRNRLREEAVSNAVETAHGRAEAAASSADLTVGEARVVRTTELRAEPYQVQNAMALTSASGSGASPGFAGGSVTVTARVLVTYDAQPS
ncbi:MAG: SIMPL domain-containing protein [Haloarculaceae archaeon]